jgi:2-polyprenyl-3-methyl-5-hydroxy-6-metoxy-1,4-benzoquinol methylase
MPRKARGSSMEKDWGAKSLYTSKQVEYFEGARLDIAQLLPDKNNFEKVLEIGCGTGKTLEWLKGTGKCQWSAGVELYPEAAKQARSKVDVIYEEDIETFSLPIKEESLDLILCLDVLEHLVDPWETINKLHRLLKKGGYIIASIPNIRHYSTSMPLLFNGNWDYKNSGILDRTHLRFFVKKTAINLIESSGLKSDKVCSLVAGNWQNIFNKLTLFLFEDFLALQYLIRVQKK